MNLDQDRSFINTSCEINFKVPNGTIDTLAVIEGKKSKTKHLMLSKNGGKYELSFGNKNAPIGAYQLEYKDNKTQNVFNFRSVSEKELQNVTTLTTFNTTSFVFEPSMTAGPNFRTCLKFRAARNGGRSTSKDIHCWMQNTNSDAYSNAKNSWTSIPAGCSVTNVGKGSFNISISEDLALNRSLVFKLECQGYGVGNAGQKTDFPFRVNYRRFV